jgi:pimeloyl-ACP methyl ester carboxylesterase
MLLNTRASADTAEQARVREDQARQVEASGQVDAVVSTLLPRLFGPVALAERGELVDQTRVVMLKTPPRGVVGSLRGMAARPSRLAELPRITIPSLVIAGADDALIPVSEAKATAAGLPNSTLVVIPETGHLAPLENSAATNAAILKFLEALT